MNRDEFKGLPCEGNHCLEGYAYDLIDHIANRRHFKYVFKLVEGNKYGKFYEDTKTWDGLLGELIDHVTIFK